MRVSCVISESWRHWGIDTTPEPISWHQAWEGKAETVPSGEGMHEVSLSLSPSLSLSFKILITPAETPNSNQKKIVGSTPKMQHPAAAPCSGTQQPSSKAQTAQQHSDGSTLQQHPPAAPHRGTSNQTPAAPSRSKAHTPLWQQHPRATLQSAHTTLTAAPSSLQQHLAAAPTCALQNADMQLVLYSK